MMEDMTHVQMSLAYTLRHLTSVLRVLSAMLSKYMREIKILGRWTFAGLPTLWLKIAGFWLPEDPGIFYEIPRISLDNPGNEKSRD